MIWLIWYTDEVIGDTIEVDAKDKKEALRKVTESIHPDDWGEDWTGSFELTLTAYRPGEDIPDEPDISKTICSSKR